MPLSNSPTNKFVCSNIVKVCVSTDSRLLQRANPNNKMASGGSDFENLPDLEELNGATLLVQFNIKLVDLTVVYCVVKVCRSH